MSTEAGSSSTPPSRTKQVDQTAFERWRRSATWITGLGLSPEDAVLRGQEVDQKMLAAQWDQCERWKRELVWYSPAVVFMRKHLALLGQPVPPEQFFCEPCEAYRSGGSANDGSILLCQDKMMSKQKMEDTMVHELIHVYDRTKFDLDWTNCRHHACTEIRASNLSGDCKWNREVMRGFFGFTKQHQECVRRRAIMAVESNQACAGPGVAEKAVDEVFASCIKDTRPFDEIF